MATDITSIRRKVFGISFLNDETNQKSVRQHWSDRFSERDTFWLEASESDTMPTVHQKLINLLEAQNVTVLTGVNCVLVFFVDCSVSLSESMLDILKRLAAALESTLGCLIDAEIQFCYVGKLGLESRNAQRESLRQAVDNNSKKPGGSFHRLCLVATPALGSAKTNNWKAALLYVDLLRRAPFLNSLLPTPGKGSANESVGYLGYEEYDEVRYVRLSEEKKLLSKLLGQNGDTELRGILEQKRSDLMELIDRKFVIAPHFQPQHPDMLVEDKFSIRPLGNLRELAKKDRNPAYTTAQAASRTAIGETGDQLEQEILELLQREIGDAASLLRQSFEQAQVGNETKRNKTMMHSVLTLPGIAAGDDLRLNLKYSSDGCEAEIGEYLEYRKQVAVAKGIKKLSDALLEAYAAYTNEVLDEEMFQLTKRLNDVEQELNGLSDAPDLCSEVSRSRDPRECLFRIANQVARSAKCLVGRGSSMAETIDENTAGTDCGTYMIDHPNGGIVNSDNAPLKALKIVYVYCDGDALLKLLPEVNV